jgi:hypothetical protein
MSGKILQLVRATHKPKQVRAYFLKSGPKGEAASPEKIVTNEDLIKRG